MNGYGINLNIATKVKIIGIWLNDHLENIAIVLNSKAETLLEFNKNMVVRAITDTNEIRAFKTTKMYSDLMSFYNEVQDKEL